jgi:RHS repeat-associated protein
MNRATRWQYDQMGRQVAKIYADGSRETYAYDPASGRLVTVTDAKGNVKTHAHYLDGQLAALRYNQPNTPNVSLTYDGADGRLASMTDGLGTTTYAYHPTTPGTLGAGQLASVDGPWANDTIAYTYDALGRILQRSIGGVPMSFSFDAAGRPTGVSNQLGSFTIGYDGVTSRPLSVTHSGGQKTEYNYLPATQDFRLQRIRHLKPDGVTPLSAFDYTYDAAGRILSWRQQEGTAANLARTWDFGYDPADQLTSAVATQGGTAVQSYGWTYDPAGNRLTQTLDGATATSSYNALNELVSTTANLPALTYEWDAEDRLLAINQGMARTEFTYDGLGRRVRLVEKQNGSVVSTQSYLWDGLSICEQRDGSGSIVNQRYFGSSYVDLTSGSPRSYLQTTDHLSSIRETTDTAGNLIQRVSYDLWGTPSFATGASTSPFAFTGHFRHAGSGLHMAPYRAYAATTGRWISRDPIGEEGGINIYAYASNNSVSYIDLDGAEPTAFRNPNAVSECAMRNTDWSSLQEDPSEQISDKIAELIAETHPVGKAMSEIKDKGGKLIKTLLPLAMCLDDPNFNRWTPTATPTRTPPFDTSGQFLRKINRIYQQSQDSMKWNSLQRDIEIINNSPLLNPTPPPQPTADLERF